MRPLRFSRKLHSRSLATAFATAALAVSSASYARDDWAEIRRDVFPGRTISEGQSGLALFAPAQAADGALVPLTVAMSETLATTARKLTIVIDRNPVPIAAVVSFGDAWRRAGQIGDRVFSTRIRVDAFSNVRAIVETDSQTLAMTAKFVAGAGGCSALPSKDIDSALANIGQMRVEKISDAGRSPNWREANIKIRHPNFTGMQMDPQSRGFTPARFVQHVEVKDGEELVATIESSISVSENPAFRLTFPGGDAALTANGVDSDGLTFAGSSVRNPS